jgi:hypothetical protein
MPNKPNKGKNTWLNEKRKEKLGRYIIDMSKLLAGGYLLKYLTGEREINYPQLVILTIIWLLLVWLGLYFVAPKEGKAK